MSNQNINELISTLEKAIALASSLPTHIENSEQSKKVNELTVELRNIVQPKMPVAQRSFIDIN